MDRDRIEKRNLIITWIFRILLILAIISSLYVQNWLNLFTSCLTMLLTFMPSFISKQVKIELIPEMNIIALLFLFAANFLGEIFEFYMRFWWWDVMLHTLSGIFLGYLGFIIVFMLNGSKSVGVSLSPIFIALFSFTFALSLGGVWEIFEFAMDKIFGMNMQKSGLVDTMWDLIVDSIGAIIASFSGYQYLKSGRRSILIKVVEKFIDKNLPN